MKKLFLLKELSKKFHPKVWREFHPWTWSTEEITGLYSHYYGQQNEEN